MSTVACAAFSLLAEAAEAHSILDTRAGMVVLLALAVFCVGGAASHLLTGWTRPAPDAEWRRQAQAELDRYKEHTRKEIDEAGARGREALITELLPMIDNLDRALDPQNRPNFSPATQSFVEGFEQIQRQLLAALERFDVRSIEPNCEPFDRRFHEAVLLVDEPAEQAGHVTYVHQRGFLHGERLLRAARVSVVRRSPREVQPCARWAI